VCVDSGQPTSDGASCGFGSVCSGGICVGSGGGGTGGSGGGY
jgi:hypothetical protein